MILDAKFTESNHELPCNTSVAVNVDGGGGGGSYELPIATPETLGGVRPVAKTDEMSVPVGVGTDGSMWTYDCRVNPMPKTEEMTQPVGVDEGGGLWTLPSGGGSGGEWELLQSYEHPEGAEELTGITITFPEEYNEFILIVNLKAPSATSNTILYPGTRVINSLGEITYGNWGFWDYYPGTNPERHSILLKKIVVNGTTYLRMSNAQHSNPVAGKPASSYKESCWWECDVNNQKFVRWSSMEIKRKIAPLSYYVLFGRK